MTHEEDDDVVRCVIETVNGRIPVICGAGSNSTQTQIEKSRKYHDMGAEKWRALGLEYQLNGVPPPDENAVTRAKELLGV